MIELPKPNSYAAVADWIELHISLESEELSKSALSSSIEATTGEEPQQIFIDDVWQELSFRERLYSRSPFEVHDETIERSFDSSTNVAYLTCLILSLFGIQEYDAYAPTLFERIVCQATKRYLKGRAFVIGWPSGQTGQASIKRKVMIIAGRLGERFAEAPPSRFKDRGVDIVSWKPFRELRSGQVVLLLQCAAGQNWKNKAPVPLTAWNQYIHWGCNPIAGFAIPSIISRTDWHEISLEKGIMFDRVRLYNLLLIGAGDLGLEEDLNAWITLKSIEFM